MTSAERSKLKRIRLWDSGKCINYCGRPFVLECGLCRECADKRNLSTRLWKARKKLSLKQNHQLTQDNG